MLGDGEKPLRTSFIMKQQSESTQLENETQSQGFMMGFIQFGYTLDTLLSPFSIRLELNQFRNHSFPFKAEASHHCQSLLLPLF